MNKLDINGLAFGIRCNFPRFCGEELTEEAIVIYKELVRLAEIGEAYEDAYKSCLFDVSLDGEELVEWSNRGKNSEY